jgi:hypothetical protein
MLPLSSSAVSGAGEVGGVRRCVRRGGVGGGAEGGGQGVDSEDERLEQVR